MRPADLHTLQARKVRSVSASIFSAGNASAQRKCRRARPSSLLPSSASRNRRSSPCSAQAQTCFALPLVERVGKHGKVYSLELSDEVARPPQIPVPGLIRMRHRENGRLPLPDESVDVALWAFAFRTLGHVASMLEETRRILRPGGRLAVVDWIRQEESFGPIRDDRVSAATCERCLAAGGFGLVGQRALNASHYLIVGRRPVGDAGGGSWESFTVSIRPGHERRI